MLVSDGLVELLTDAELEALLLHEREHLRQRDPLKLFLGKLLTASVFFLPVVAALYRRYLVEKELAADRAAILEHGSSESLAAALLKLLATAAPPAPAVGAAASEALEQRIDALFDEPLRLGSQMTLAQRAVSLVIAVLVTIPVLLPTAPADATSASYRVVPGCHLATETPAHT